MEIAKLSWWTQRMRVQEQQLLWPAYSESYMQYEESQGEGVFFLSLSYTSRAQWAFSLKQI